MSCTERNIDMIWIYIEIGILCMVLSVATVEEKLKEEINAYTWIGGGIVDLVYHFWGKGICVMRESLIAFAITVIVGFIAFAIVSGVIGGGILKGIMMCSIYLGRWISLAVVMFLLLTGIARSVFFKKKKRNYVEGNRVLAMPFLDCSVIIALICSMIMIK